jgi:hypothetical protein
MRAATEAIWRSFGENLTDAIVPRGGVASRL